MLQGPNDPSINARRVPHMPRVSVLILAVRETFGMLLSASKMQRVVTRREAVSLFFMLCSAGCIRNGSKLVVGFSQMENNNPWRIAQTNSMRAEAERRGNKYEILITDAQGQTAKQVADVEDLIARRVSALFLAPREFEGLAPALESAKDAGIPVFLIDREAEGKAGEDYVCFLGSDFVKQAEQVADWLVRHTHGKASIAELTGTPGSSVARDRSQGFASRLKNEPGMKIIASQSADFSRATAQGVMENLVQALRNEITAVYAQNDEMALGAITALKSAGLRPGVDVTVVSVDGEKAALEAIMRGELGATAESNPRFGPLAFETLERHRLGEQIPSKIILRDNFFDASNAGQFISTAY
jgi:galactofuranose transport system substrate-binding protein